LIFLDRGAVGQIGYFRMLFAGPGFGQTCSNSISPRRWAAISFIASTRSCPKLHFCNHGRIPLPLSRNLRERFCDVHCHVTLPRVGENDRFCAAARQRSIPLTAPAIASEAPQFQELRRHSRYRRSPPHTVPGLFTRRRSQVRVLSRPPFSSVSDPDRLGT
jgi:hypothetical protein